MTKLIGFGRCLGKTTMAILESHATGKYILCANHNRARAAFYQAKELGYTIPHPITTLDLRHQAHQMIPRDEEIIVDDVESVLSALIGCPIATITFGSQNLQSEKDRYIEEIAELKKRTQRLL